MTETFYPAKAVGVALGFLVCIVAHHYAHARVAIAMGDRTPKLHGRATLSIKPHVDTLGTIILPIVWSVVALFLSPIRVQIQGVFPFVGWGKAQSVQPHLMKKGRTGVIITALAGPLTTAVIALVAMVVFVNLVAGSFGGRVVGGIAYVAVHLTVWELLPMPGRDGGRILAEFLSPTGKLKMQDLAQYEVLFVIGAFLLLAGIVITPLGDLLCQAAADVPCRLLLV